MDMFVGVHDSDWLRGRKVIAAWYTLKEEMEVPADGNECVNVEWKLRPCTELSETVGWDIEGRKSSFLDLGEKSIWMTIRHHQVTGWMHNYINSQELRREDG